MSVSVRPVLTEVGLGSVAWEVLHRTADMRGRSPREQAIQLLRFALYQALIGRDVELKDTQLRSLLEPEPQAA